MNNKIFIDTEQDVSANCIETNGGMKQERSLSPVPLNVHVDAMPVEWENIIPAIGIQVDNENNFIR
jgi:hypothetical protein